MLSDSDIVLFIYTIPYFFRGYLGFLLDFFMSKRLELKEYKVFYGFEHTI